MRDEASSVGFKSTDKFSPGMIGCTGLLILVVGLIAVVIGLVAISA